MSRTVGPLSLALVAALWAGPAQADVVVLVGGETIEGIVRQTETQVIVELDIGTLTLDKASVREIRKSNTKLDELRARRQKIASNDPDGLFELASWAQANGLHTQAHALCKEILKLDDGHRGAWTMLGFRAHEGRWLTEEEYMAATGHVRYRGAWLEAKEAERLEEARRERETARAKEARLTAMELSVKQAQLEAAEARAEAERARREAESAQESRWMMTGGMGFWPYNPYPNVYPHVHPPVAYPSAAPQPAPAPAPPPPAPPPVGKASASGFRR